MTLDEIPPGYTAVAQLKTRTVGSNTPGANVGSPITGVAGVFDLGAYATGDYWCEITGVSIPPAAAFPVRDDVAYPYMPWKVIDATIRADPPTPSPITGLCSLLFSIVNGSGSPVFKASCYAQLDSNSTYDGGLVASTVYSAQTDEDGLATLVCIRDNQFTAGGIYTLRATDRQGLLLWTKRVRIPNTDSANAEDLTAV
jgi:hypothetical protein